jgi:hypothetical protein
MEEKKEAVFPNGVFFNKPHEKAPDFVKGSISFADVDSFIAFLKQHQKNNKLTLDMKKSQKGSLYFQLNEWEPKPKDTDEALKDDEIPF